MATKAKTAAAPYINKVAQYDIVYKGRSIESTGYLDSLAAAKQFARRRYGAEVQVMCVYPDSFRDGVLHKV